MFGTLTVKTGDWLAVSELTVTLTGPVVTLLGATAVIEPLLQLVIEAAGTPLNVTVLVPCVEPKLDPEMVTGVPGIPDVGLRLVTGGFGIIVKLVPALVWLLTLTV